MSQFVEYGFQGRHQPVGFYLVEHLFYFVRLLTSFFDEVGFAKFHKHSLGPQRYQSPGCLDQDTTCFYQGSGDFFEYRSAVFKVLYDLFHRGGAGFILP